MWNIVADGFRGGPRGYDTATSRKTSMWKNFPGSAGTPVLMSMPKRGRIPDYSSYIAADQSRLDARMLTPGYTRIGGNFGRYRNPSGAGKEKKFRDTLVAGTTISATGVILNTSINLVPQGDAPNQRIGRKIWIKSIYMKMLFESPQGSNNVGTTENIRLIVYVDMQTNGAVATIATLFQTTDFQTFRNLENSGRYKTLFDKTICINRHAGAGASVTVNGWARMCVLKKWFKRFKKPIPVMFDGATGALTEICCQNIGLAAFSQNATGELLGNIRIRYTD